MSSTTFHPDQTQMDNAVTVHVKGEEDGTHGRRLATSSTLTRLVGGRPRLFSTPRDYIRSSRRSCEVASSTACASWTKPRSTPPFTNQIGDLDFPAEIPTADPPITDTMYAGPGNKWGYGLLLNSHDIPGRRRAGTGSWAGLFNTHFFIDRTTGICASIYTNSLPFITRHEAWKLYGDC